MAIREYFIEKAIDLTLTYLASKLEESRNSYHYDCTYDNLISTANDYLKEIDINEISSKDIPIIRLALHLLVSAYAHKPSNDLIVAIIRIHYALGDNQKFINDWAERISIFNGASHASELWEPCNELEKYIGSEKYSDLYHDYYDTKKSLERIEKEGEERFQQVKDDWELFNAEYPGYP